MSIREQNQLLLDSTFLQLPCEDHEHDDDEHLEGPPLSLQRRIEASNYLLDIDNDRWCSDQIVHWCKFGCCGSVKESKLKLWVALQDRIGLFFFIVCNYQSRPEVFQIFYSVLCSPSNM